MDENENKIDPKLEKLLRSAELRLDCKDFKGAVKVYDKVLIEFPDDIWTLWERGVAKKSRKDYSGALADFNKVIELDPDHSYAYYQRAEIKERRGDKKGAAQDFALVERIRSGLPKKTELLKSDNPDGACLIKDGPPPPLT